MDAKSAFLTGNLKKEAQVGQPPGFENKGEENKVLKLHKALYGLRQAPRDWNSNLEKIFGDTRIWVMSIGACSVQEEI